VSFDVPAAAYARFMGRYSMPLAAQFVRLLGPQPGQRALDVGCGPGVLTALLVERLGSAAVRAVDPSEPFVVAARNRFPDVEVRQGVAEALPYADDEFDLAAAQLVVHFMTDPAAGLREMRRVTRPGGLVAASVWDYGGGRAPISAFWRAVRQMEPASTGEAHLAGARDGQLVELFAGAGLHDVRQSVLRVRVPVAGFEEWWEPFTLGVGPGGVHVARLDEAQGAELKARCAALLPGGPFEIDACAWVATGRA
jgi:SAM-dependent methyltransferase